MAKSTDGWSGWVAFAAFMVMLSGFFQGFVGLTAILRDEFFIVAPNSLVTIDVTSWGWAHLLIGIVLVLAGNAILNGKVWGRTVGVVMAVLSAVANLAFIPHYPIWSIVVIVIDVLVIYALTVHGRDLVE
jgi:hypothetical protein